MDTQMTVAAPSDPLDSMKVVKDSVAAFNQIFLKTNEDLLKIQSASGTSAILESLMKMASFMSRTSAPSFVWQIPELYQTASETTLKYLVDSAGVLSRSQQSLLELTTQSLTRTVQQTAKAMTTVNETLASRRVSAEIIDFADRRTKAQALSTRTADTSGEQDVSYPVARKSAGWAAQAN